MRLKWGMRQRLRSIDVVEVARLDAPDGFPELVTMGVGPSGDLACVWASVEEAPCMSPHLGLADDPNAGLVPPGPQSPPSLLATYDSAGSLIHSTVVQQGLPLSFPLVQPLGGNSYLVVGARSEWRPDGIEENAVVLDAEGREVRRGCLGDGVQHLQRAGDGTVWIGYSDEGVFGSSGWNGPGPTPLGAAGLVQWSEDLTVLWEHDQELSSIYDCYALNVSTVAGVLACSYDDFTITKVDDGGQERRFTTHKVTGPRGLLVDGDRVALIGDYDSVGLVILGRLDGGRFVEAGRAEFTIDGQPLPRDVVLHCRGAVLDLFRTQRWYRLDLRHVDL